MVQLGRSKALYGIYMRNLGFELEMSDILTKDAAQIVYGDLSLWQDRWGGYNKPNLDYSKWHIQSDGTLLNTNGTHCMSTYMDEAGLIRSANNGKSSAHRMFWQGAELISPVFTDEDTPQIVNQLFGYIEQFKSAGAIFSSKFNNSLHVHVDVSDIDKETVLGLLWRIYDVQDRLDSLGNDWNGRRKFTLEEVANLTSLSEKDFVEEYLKTRTGRKIHFSANSARRIVDIGPKFNPNKPDTIEFRCFKAVPDVNYIVECVLLCQWLIEEWVKGISPDYDLILNEKLTKIKLLEGMS